MSVHVKLTDIDDNPIQFRNPTTVGEIFVSYLSDPFRVESEIVCNVSLKVCFRHRLSTQSWFRWTRMT